MYKCMNTNYLGIMHKIIINLERVNKAKKGVRWTYFGQASHI